MGARRRRGAPERRPRLSTAKVVGAAPRTTSRCCASRVPDRRPAALPIGTSADLRVGQKVFAIGNPFGLDRSLTTGVISALDRSLPARRRAHDHRAPDPDRRGDQPGNSGGPLLDSSGRLIGINTAIFSPSGAYAGVGFAVPVDTVNRVVPQLVAKGKYTRPVLGLEIDEQLSQQIAARSGTKGVAVVKVVPGSPAEAAGMRAGDVIAAIDGKPVTSAAQLVNRLDEHKVGDTVRLTVQRDGKPVELTATLKAGA